MTDDTAEQRAAALEARLEEHGHLHHEDLDAAIAAAESPEGDQPSTALGARVVARAWVDDDFRARLLDDAAAALAEYRQQPVPIAVLENTAEVHNVVVCTLCSCYPSGLLGNPPAWYKSFEYRSRVVREPRAVLEEFGLHLGVDVQLRVHDSTAEQRYLVLPRRPEGTEGWPADRLAGLVTRNSMVGTGVALEP